MVKEHSHRYVEDDVMARDEIIKITKNPRLLAEFIHNIYEEKSKKTGWETQKKTRVEFLKLPRSNKIVMLHVSKKIIQLFEEAKA